MCSGALGVFNMMCIYVFLLSMLRFGYSKEAIFSRKTQTLLSNHTDTYIVRSELDCGVTCMLDDDCWSVSYNGATQVCLLSDVKVKEIQDYWIEDVEWQTFTKIGGTFVSSGKHVRVMYIP